MSRRVVIIAVLVVVIIGVFVLPLRLAPRASVRHVAPPAVTAPAATAPAIAPPTTVPATAPAPPPPATVLDVLKLARPTLYATVKPLDLPADLSDAARIELDTPAYVDLLGNLWLTHPQGRAIGEVLAGPVADRTAVVRERVRCVFWPADGGAGAAVVGEDGALSLVTPAGTTALPMTGTPDFSRALPCGNAVLLPFYDGILRLFDGPPRIVELPFARDVLTTGFTGPAAPAMAVTGDGVLAWSPWESGHVGSDGAILIGFDGHVSRRNLEQGWPDKPIQLVPLADGSTLALSAAEPNAAPELKYVAAPTAPTNDAQTNAVRPIAEKLADPDPTARDAAQRQIEAMGPGVLPTLAAMQDGLPPEAAVRIEALLGTRLTPTLAGLHPLPGPVTTIARFPAGGGLIRLDGGGLLDQDNGTQQSVIPAVVLIRPGSPLERIETETAGRLGTKPDCVQCVNGELIAMNKEDGPQRWVGTALVPLLPPPLRHYTRLLAVDGRRRWLLADPAVPGKSLLIDPGLPDVAPRLPVWTLDPGDKAGWTDAGWPAIRRGDRVLVLEAHGWTDAKPEQQHILPTTRPADGQFTVTAAGHTFVYTPDGTVRRYSGTTGPTTGPSAIPPEATFTTAIPAAATRVWLDPAGRLVVIGPGAVAVAFPDGRVPADLKGLMLRPAE